MERSALIEDLRSRVVTVTFTKKDGSERVMQATLHPDYLPPVDPDKAPSTRPVNEANVSVYDVEANGWRTIIIENIISVE